MRFILYEGKYLSRLFTNRTFFFFLSCWALFHKLTFNKGEKERGESSVTPASFIRLLSLVLSLDFSGNGRFFRIFLNCLTHQIPFSFFFFYYDFLFYPISFSPTFKFLSLSPKEVLWFHLSLLGDQKESYLMDGVGPRISRLRATS
jgi:hypothetical protein